MLAVYGAPYSTQSASTALQFANALLAKGHTLQQVFFYQDGTYNASYCSILPSNERNLNQLWQCLAERAGIRLMVCISAALRRGLLNAEEAERYEKTETVKSPFLLTSLSEFLEAATGCDRLITFGR